MDLPIGQLICAVILCPVLRLWQRYIRERSEFMTRGVEELTGEAGKIVVPP